MESRHYIEKMFTYLRYIIVPSQYSPLFARKLPETGFLLKEGRDGGEGDRVIKVLGKTGDCN